MKLESALQHGDLRDLVASDLSGELQAIARRLSGETKSPQDVFRFILCQNLEDSLPNLCIALRILLTTCFCRQRREKFFQTKIDKDIHSIIHVPRQIGWVGNSFH